MLSVLVRWKIPASLLEKGVKYILGKVVRAEAAWRKTGTRMTDAEVAELAQLKEASKTRALSFNEENRLHLLGRKSISVTHSW